MNSMKVQYFIKDVIDENPPQFSKSIRKRLHQDPKISVKPMKAEIAKYSISSKVERGNVEPNKPSNTQNLISCVDDSIQLPVRSPSRRPSSGFPINRKNKEGPPPWNNRSVRPDRDLLIMEQDLAISKYRYEHNPNAVCTEEANLTDSNVREIKKRTTSLIRRDRLEPKTCGIVVNDPLPFHPYLKVAAAVVADGIQASAWANSMVYESDRAEAWVRPSTKADNKSRNAFYREYRLSNDEKTTGCIDNVSVSHNLSSIASTYSRIAAGNVAARYPKSIK